MKKALITGVTGQDGSYLAELLLEKGYEVHGLVRRASTFNTKRIDHIFQEYDGNDPNFITHNGDLSDYSSLDRVIRHVRPHEIYNLAAQSHVGYSFDAPEYTMDVNATGTLRLLEAIRNAGLSHGTRFYNAATSELFGGTKRTLLDETSELEPRSPYAIAKLASFWATRMFRDAYGMFAVNGILFNHESPRRGETFVTRKITRGLAEIVVGSKQTLFLGNLDSCRDWGHAKDYVKAQWLMLQQEIAKDYVIATGQSVSVRTFLDIVLNLLSISVTKIGDGKNEKWIVQEFDERWNLERGQSIIEVNQRLYRPLEVDYLQGNANKARSELNWHPTYDVTALAQDMLTSDLTALSIEY